ncbi:MAG: hypothetical protein MPI93_01960 [Nitrosopumilus sp.]|nr:hypothetical protein [Nitrosopumilus sp.]
MATASALGAQGGPPAGTLRTRAGDPRLAQVRRDLVYRLPTYSGAAAQAYEGALSILAAGPHADRPSHLAYAMRDVVDHLARRAQDRYEGAPGRADRGARGRVRAAAERRRGTRGPRRTCRRGRYRAPGCRHRRPHHPDIPDPETRTARLGAILPATGPGAACGRP